jgi:capsular exopolysaccharide synthesis family protein
MSNEKDIFDFKQYYLIVIKYWYIAVLILFVAYIYAWFNIRYATPIYQVKNSIQIKDKSNNVQKQLYDGSSFFQTTKNLNNEIELIKSYNQVLAVLKELDFVWEYTVHGSIKDISIYRTEPFRLVVDSNFVPIHSVFSIKPINENECIVNFNYQSSQWYSLKEYKLRDSILIPVNLKDVKVSFGDTIIQGMLKFSIQKTPQFNSQSIGQEFSVIARDLHYLTKVYKSKLNATRAEKSSIITLTSSGPLVEKEAVFLNKVAEVYIRKDLSDKNQIATNTINFIDAQLNIISDSLDISSEGLQSYKETNKVYAISEQAQNIMSQIKDIEEKKLSQEIQLRYYSYLNDYIHSEKETGDLVAPSTININDPILSNLVSQLIQLYQEKNTLQYTSSEKSANYKSLQLKINSIREALIETSSNLVHTTKLSINDLNNRIYILENELSKIPEKERALLNIQRKHTINDNIYNYLLQKRAEASIARASSLSDAFVVEFARTDEYSLVAPISKSIYTKYLLVAVALIVFFIFLYSKMDNKIKSKEDAHVISGIPVLGSIFLVSESEEKSKTVYSGHSLLTESFRSLRTNLQFLIKNKKNSVIGVTSCISGDGKSFCSQNLAKVYAISGKKTLLIHGDLRKPFELSYPYLSPVTKGLSEYLIEQATLSDIIHSSGLDNLDVIVPGILPPNASELFASEIMGHLVDELRKKYSLIIIDSPPIGIVSDYLSLLEYIDVNLFVIRHDYTPKANVEDLKSIYKKDLVKEAGWIVYNGEKGKGNSYNYAYKYNYIGESTQQPWWKKWVKVK